MFEVRRLREENEGAFISFVSYIGRLRFEDQPKYQCRQCSRPDLGTRCLHGVGAVDTAGSQTDDVDDWRLLVRILIGILIYRHRVSVDDGWDELDDNVDGVDVVDELDRYDQWFSQRRFEFAEHVWVHRHG